MLYYISGVVCQKVITDARTNSPSYIDDLAGVEVIMTDIPTSLPPFVVSTTLGRDPKDKQEGHRFRIVVENPSKKEIISGPFPIIFENKNLVSRVNIEIPSFPVSEVGRYFISIQTAKGKKWPEVSRVPFSVKRAVQKEEKK